MSGAPSSENCRCARSRSRRTPRSRRAGPRTPSGRRADSWRRRPTASRPTRLVMQALAAAREHGRGHAGVRPPAHAAARGARDDAGPGGRCAARPAAGRRRGGAPPRPGSPASRPACTGRGRGRSWRARPRCSGCGGPGRRRAAGRRAWRCSRASRASGRRASPRTSRSRHTPRAAACCSAAVTRGARALRAVRRGPAAAARLGLARARRGARARDARAGLRGRSESGGFGRSGHRATCSSTRSRAPSMPPLGSGRSCWCSTTCTGPSRRPCCCCATSCAQPRGCLC